MNYFLKLLGVSFCISFIILGSFAIGTPTRVYAQSGPSLSGDDVCGSSSSTKCTLDDGKRIIRAFVTNLVIPIGLTLLTVFIILRILMAQKALMEGNANAYKEASKKIANAIVSFVVIVAVIGGLALAILRFLGVEDTFTFLLSYETTPYSQVFVNAFVSTAYAQEPTCGPGAGSTCLNNPVGITSLYDFILTVVRLFIRWFVFPAIIFMWVFTGFKFVAAQGRPDEIVKAKKWLLWGIIATVVVALTEGFLFAIRGTVNAILPGAAVNIIDYGTILATVISTITRYL